MAMSREAARNIVGIIGNVISFLLFMSPIKTFFTIFKKKNVEGFKSDPYIATVMNCMLWIFYGLPVVHPDSTLVITINGFGLGLELVYLIIFVIYGTNKDRKKIGLLFAIEIIALAVIATITLLVFHTHEKRSMVVGILCVIFGTIMYASPLTVMWKVITTRSVKYMPFLLSLTSFLNGTVWLVYALIKFDLFILIANGLGAILGGLQLLIYIVVSCCSTPRDEDDEVTKPSQVQLSGAV